MIGIPFPVNILLLTQNEVIPTREMDSAYPEQPCTSNSDFQRMVED